MHLCLLTVWVNLYIGVCIMDDDLVITDQDMRHGLTAWQVYIAIHSYRARASSFKIVWPLGVGGPKGLCPYQYICACHNVTAMANGL